MTLEQFFNIKDTIKRLDDQIMTFAVNSMPITPAEKAIEKLLRKMQHKYEIIIEWHQLKVKIQSLKRDEKILLYKKFKQKKTFEVVAKELGVGIRTAMRRMESIRKKLKALQVSL